MSSFFTLTASQKKRKRPQGHGGARGVQKKPSTAKTPRDASISGSDVSDDDAPARAQDYDDSDESDEESLDEDPAAKRLRLAEQYLANTQKEVLEHDGFDALDVDADNLRRRMGERLKEDNAESKGKLYRWIAEDFDWSKAEGVPFRHHQKALTGVAISGEFVYTVSRDTVLVKWRLPHDLDTGATEMKRPRSKKPRKILTSQPFRSPTGSDPERHTGAILCVAASQDGRFVATGGADKKLIIWDAATLKPLKVFLQHRDAVTSLAFRRDTNQLFSTSKDRSVKIWSLDELAYVETLFGHQNEVADVSALAQETCVSVGARDRTARYWKVVEESQLIFRGGGAPGKYQDTHRYSMDSGIDMGESEVYHEGSVDRVARIDEETFVTGSDSGALSLWNINKKKAVFTYTLAHGLDSVLPVEDTSAEEHPEESARPKPQPRWITALRAIPFSDIFISASWDGYVRAWKVSSDKRRIESLGRLGCIEKSVHTFLDQKGLGSESLSNVALQVIRTRKEKQGRIDGFVNDLAIVDKGERAKDGLIVVAAIGKEPRLGRWKDMKTARNYAVLFEIPRNSAGQPEFSASDADAVKDAEPDDDFAGFD